MVKQLGKIEARKANNKREVKKENKKKKLLHLFNVWIMQWKNLIDYQMAAADAQLVKVIRLTLRFR